ncbi:hypothetical protein H4R33_005345, partial [Dimargaris cristalligena]
NALKNTDHKIFRQILPNSIEPLLGSILDTIEGIEMVATIKDSLPEPDPVSQNPANMDHVPLIINKIKPRIEKFYKLVRHCSSQRPETG